MARSATNKQIESISAAEARKRLEAESECWQVLDVRRPEEFQAVRIEGSLNVPLAALPGRSGEIRATGRQYIISCQSGVRASMAADILLAGGMAPVTVLGDSLDGWLADGGPVIREKVPVSMERQVRAIAGTLVLGGALLGWLVSPWFLLIPIWVGSGLLFAGLSGSCMMAKLLMKAPYNRQAMVD